MTYSESLMSENTALRVGLRIPNPQANQIKEIAKHRGISTSMAARIILIKALAEGITV